MPFKLEIVSPEKLLLSRDVDMAVIPGSEGDIGVLEGHSPMMVTLRGGVVSLYEGERVTDTLFVASGFAEITTESCTVLAAEAMPVSALERADAEKRLRDAEEAYAQSEGGSTVEQELALDRITSARGMLEAIDGLLTGQH